MTSKLKSCREETKQSGAGFSPFSRVFDHCSFVLFSFLTDTEVAAVACALCAPRFLSAKRYIIKRPVPIRALLAGLYPCAASRVVFDRSQDEPSLVAKLPSSVQSLNIDCLFGLVNSQPCPGVRDLPRSLTHLAYHDAGPDAHVASDDWPPALTSLFVKRCSEPLPPLPSTLRALECGFIECRHVELPRSLMSLKMWTAVQRHLLSQLPPGLTTLDIQIPDHTQPDELAHLPASLTDLTLRCTLCTWRGTELRLPRRLRRLVLQNFRVLGRTLPLPPSLEVLDLFGCTYHGPLRHASLRTLLQPNDSKQRIMASDFPALRVLSLSGSYEHSLDHLPPLLTDLSMQRGENAYAHPISAVTLPASLKRLELLRELPAGGLSWLRLSYTQWPLTNLPRALTELDLSLSSFNQPLDHLPPQLQVLKLGIASDQPLDHLPAGLTELYFSFTSYYNRPLDRLPLSLRKLQLPRGFNQPLDHLPPKLESLTIGLHFASDFNQPLNHLPDSLTRLHLDRCVYFNHPLTRLPRNLIELHLGESFNHPLPLTELKSSSEVLPESQSSSSFSLLSMLMRPLRWWSSKTVTYPSRLRSLHLGQAFNQPLFLPPSLTHLVIARKGDFAHPLPAASLPEKLILLQLPSTYEGLDEAAVRARCPYAAII